MATTCHLFEFSRGPSKKLREIVEYSLDTFARFTKNTPLGSQTIHWAGYQNPEPFVKVGPNPKICKSWT